MPCVNMPDSVCAQIWEPLMAFGVMLLNGLIILACVYCCVRAAFGSAAEANEGVVEHEWTSGGPLGITLEAVPPNEFM